MKKYQILSNLAFCLLIYINDSNANENKPISISSSYFTNTIGINTHIDGARLNSNSTSYGNPIAIAKYLKYIGVTHLRDNLSIGPYFPAFSYLNSVNGVTFDLTYANYAANSGSNIIDQYLNSLEKISPIVEAIEGPNEPDFFGVFYNGITGAPAVIDSQKYIYQSVKSNPILQKIPVFCTALSYPADGGMATAIGNLAPYCDYANLHAYPENNALNASYPSTNMSLPYQFLSVWKGFPDTITAPGRPEVITEGGWSTDINSMNGVDEETQSKYYVEYLLDAFSLGISRTYMYELMDDAPDPYMTAEENHYGIFHYDGTPKITANVISNINTLFKDKVSKPSTVSYTIKTTAQNTHSLLLQKNDHTFILALWNEAVLWDPSSRTELPQAPITVNLNFNEVIGSVNIYDPFIGIHSQGSLENVQNMAVALPDHPVFVFIEP